MLGVLGAMQHEQSEMMRCRPGTDRNSRRSRICGASFRAAPRARHGFAVSAIILLCTTPALAAGSVSAGRQKAMQCQTCHGLDGLSKLPDAPNIAGSPEPYLARQ